MIVQPTLCMHCMSPHALHALRSLTLLDPITLITLYYQNIFVSITNKSANKVKVNFSLSTTSHHTMKILNRTHFVVLKLSTGRKVHPVATQLTFSFRGIGRIFRLNNPPLGPYMRQKAGIMTCQNTVLTFCFLCDRTVCWHVITLSLPFVLYKGLMMD